ncbi:type IV pilus twitching motility protein PilT [Methylomusa anaerophila]|nr:type IV pilus twitching motility protein PilT [Methylomusa anaerophila]
MNSLLKQAVLLQASDIHFTVGIPPIARLKGSLTPIEHPVLTGEDMEALFSQIADTDQQSRFHQLGELDFSYALSGISRFRVNAFKQRGTIAIAVRVVAERIPALKELGYPEILRTFTRKSRGLVLVTGPTGCGKSTTLAAMLDLINNERSCHIITLEDPIEYLHHHKKSIVNQREINTDTISFASALRAVLREDPDVIMIGEMRDVETIGIALTAAETGHLVFATLHTGDAVQTVDRIVDVFPPHQHRQVRIQLSLTLQGVIAQQLIPRCDNYDRVAALEVLVATPAVRNLIREGKTHQLASVIQTGAKMGMQAMDMSLKNLYHRGIITYDEALSRAVDQEGFIRTINDKDC